MLADRVRMGSGSSKNIAPYSLYNHRNLKDIFTNTQEVVGNNHYLTFLNNRVILSMEFNVPSCNLVSLDNETMGSPIVVATFPYGSRTLNDSFRIDNNRAIISGTEYGGMSSKVYYNNEQMSAFTHFSNRNSVAYAPFDNGENKLYGTRYPYRSENTAGISELNLDNMNVTNVTSIVHSFTSSAVSMVNIGNKLLATVGSTLYSYDISTNTIIGSVEVSGTVPIVRKLGGRGIFQRGLAMVSVSPDLSNEESTTILGTRHFEIQDNLIYLVTDGVCAILSPKLEILQQFSLGKGGAIAITISPESHIYVTFRDLSISQYRN